MTPRYFDVEYVVKSEWDAIKVRLQRTPKDVQFFPILVEACSWHSYPEIEAWCVNPKTADSSEPEARERKPEPKPVSEFSPDDQSRMPQLLGRRVLEAVEGALKSKPSDVLAAPVFWVEHFDAPSSTTGGFIGREKARHELAKAMVDGRGGVVAITGDGGYGKSALVNDWLVSHGRSDFAETHVLAYTFTGPGVPGGGTNSGAFFAGALQKFGVGGSQGPRGYGQSGVDAELLARSSQADSERARARQLLDLIFDSAEQRSRKFVIILDGVDVLRQNVLCQKVGESEKRFDDPGMSSFIDLVKRGLPRGCKIVLTCRFAIKELARSPRPGTGSPDAPQDLFVTAIELEGLNWPECRELLYANGISTNYCEDDMDRYLGENYEYFLGNPLALVLYAGYVHRAHQGMPTYAGFAAGGLATKYPSHWVQQSAEWLSNHHRSASRFLRTLGLVHRPLVEDEYVQLQPCMELPELDSDEFRQMIDLLVDMQLIDGNANGGRWACHALARDWFAEDFEWNDRARWQAGHGVLFDYFREQGAWAGKGTKAPDLEPLYRAVIHGCLADRLEDAFRVYWEEIHRGDAAYSTNSLGNHSRDLSALAGFFERNGGGSDTGEKPVRVPARVVDWRRPRIGLADTTKERVTGVAAFCLHSVGLMEHAIAAREAHLAVLGRRLSIAKSYECDSLLARGRLSDARKAAEKAFNEAVGLGEESWAERVEALSRLGVVCHLMGDLLGAFVHFNEARVLLDAHKSTKWGNRLLSSEGAEAPGCGAGPPPGLYSLPGSRWWELQLTMAGSVAELEAIESQVRGVLDWLDQGGREIGPMGEPITWRLDRPLAVVALGRIAGRLGRPDAEGLMEQAVTETWASGQIDQVPGALLARAQWRRTLPDEEAKRAALADANKALDLAETFGLRLHSLDAWLLLCEIHLDGGELIDARTCLEKARAGCRLIPQYKRIEVRLLLARARLCFEDYKKGRASDQASRRLLGDSKRFLREARARVADRKQGWDLAELSLLEKRVDEAAAADPG